MTVGPRRASRALPVLCLVLAGCPVSHPAPDAWVDFDAGNPGAKDACSGGCGSNQRCDTVKRECVDGCGGCDAGLCVQVSDGVFQCLSASLTCSGATCAEGQLACVGGACSCLATANGAGDSCASQGKWCGSGACASPQRYEQCVKDSTTAACPAGHTCESVFGGDRPICVKRCGIPGVSCDRGEICTSLATGPGCLPLGLFLNQECAQNVPLADGGFQKADGGANLMILVPISSTCLLKDSAGHSAEDAGTGSGNCTVELFKFWDQGLAPSPTCRPPGHALEGETCKKDLTSAAIGTQCSTGLECALTSGADGGVCLRLCNANPGTAAHPATPACLAGEACANLHRTTDPSNNSVLGVCMKSCNVFDPASNSCPAVGSAPASCVPTTAGTTLVSTGGDGLCVPQQSTISAVGQPCGATDPFHGATCATGSLCSSTGSAAVATCTRVCDLDCAPADGGPGPARCQTEANATCQAGKTCTVVSSTSGAVMGFCL